LLKRLPKGGAGCAGAIWLPLTGDPGFFGEFVALEPPKSPKNPGHRF